jgi:hypothetical protein
VLIKVALPGSVRARGFSVEDGPDGRLENETFTCAHCNTVVDIPHRCPPDQLGGRCFQCDAMICSACVAVGACTPFERKLEQYEARDRFLRQAGL